MNRLVQFFKNMVWAILLLIYMPIACVQASPEIMTVDQLQPGMHGVAKTVIRGTAVESFDVEIIGVLRDGAPEGMILGRVSGDVINQTAGVLQGMSGSPVYIDGKLVGAISGGWPSIDARVCAITPIAEMLKIWDMPDDKGEKKIHQVEVNAPLETANVEKDKVSALESKEESKDLFLEKEKEVVEAVKQVDPEKASTMLVATGFTPAAFSMLEEKLAPLGMKPYQGIGSANDSYAPIQLEPGSALGVALVRGDFSLAATGTVTAIEGNKLVAFGHPFYRRGNVNYFLTDAVVLTSEHGLNGGFKFGQTGNLIGVINQDRTAGIGGVIGKYPSVIPMQITVKDKQLNKDSVYNLQLAYDEELTAPLAASMVYNAIDKTMDRIGESTAKIDFEIQANSVPGGVIKRDNMYYSMQDSGQLAVGELFQALNMLSTNTFHEIDIFSVKANVEIDQTRRTASIISAIPKKTAVKPGETVDIAVKLKPYRSEEVTVNVPYTVPAKQPKGTMMLEVRGGGLISLAQLMMKQQGIDLSAEEDKTRPLEEDIKKFLEANKNNEIVVAPGVMNPNLPNQNKPIQEPQQVQEPINPVVPEESSKTEDVSERKMGTIGDEKLEEENVQSKNRKTVDYIIDNIQRISLKVE